MIKRNVRVLALVLVFAMMFSTVAFAAEGDHFYKATGLLAYGSNQVRADVNAKNHVRSLPNLFQIEVNGELYDLAAANAAYAQDKQNWKEILTGKEPDEPIENSWAIKLSTTADDNTIIANGDDNTTIIIEIVDENGVVQPVNGITIELFTSHGSLASTGDESRVTLQNGVGTIKLNSESSASPLVAEITAKLYEAAQVHKDAIGQHEVIFNVFFQPEELNELVAPPVLVGAESNQADRVTLFFDKEVDIEDFEADLRFLSDVSDAEGMFPVVVQDGYMYEVLGYLPVEGNPKALVAVIGYNMEIFDYLIRLTDNTWTGVWSVSYSDYGLTTNYVEFLLTDARKPELERIAMDGSMTTLRLEFSESISAIEDIVIDGGIVNVTGWDVDEFEYAGWDEDDNFYPAEDYRHFVDVYVQGWMTAGEHSITVFGAKDWAGDSDPKNISTTQTLEFTVDVNDEKPEIEVIVESPEQIRVILPEDYEFNVEEEYGNNWMVQYLDGETWTTVTEGAISTFDNEIVLEMNIDWTEKFDTENTEMNYYNYDFRLWAAADVIINMDNGLTNDEIKFDLNYDGSPLNGPDTISPKLIEVDQYDDYEFDIYMDEPLKGRGLDISEDFDILDTPSQQQQTAGGTPEIVVEFIGYDKDGVQRTIVGQAWFAEAWMSSADNIVTVDDNNQLQDLVDDEGYAEEWTLNVKNITDDIGNAAETVTFNFIVEKTPPETPSEPVDNEFWVEYVTADYYGDSEGLEEPNAVFVYFTDYVKTAGGAESAILLSNYSINNQSLPAGSYVRINTATEEKDIDGNTLGYYGVIIVLGEGFEWAVSNTLEVAKTLKSLDGYSLLGFDGYPEYSRYQEVIDY